LAFGRNEPSDFLSGLRFRGCYRGEQSMNDDSQLLRRYGEEHSESAFAELVSRHIDLVYPIVAITGRQVAI